MTLLRGENVTSNVRGSKGHELNHLAMLPWSKIKHVKHWGWKMRFSFLGRLPARVRDMLVLGDCKLLEGEKNKS